MMTLTLPLYVYYGKKNPRRYYINLNVYRNTHFMKLDTIKKSYMDLVGLELKRQGIQFRDPLPAVCLSYIIFPHRVVDIANPLSIIDKFTSDALIKNGIIADDNSRVVREVRFRLGAIDTKDPRAELSIISL